MNDFRDSKGFKTLNNNKGSALIIALAVMTILLLIGGAGLLMSNQETQISGNGVLVKKAFYAAEAGTEYGLSNLRGLLQNTLYPTINIPAPTMAGYAIEDFSVVKLNATPVQMDINQGTYRGLQAFLTRYEIKTKARVNNSNTNASVGLLVDDQLIPIFQFGIFYYNDLEMIPGARMDYSGGRIHSNHDIYLQANGTTFNINAPITTAGDIINGQKDGTARSTGTVQIMDGKNPPAYQTLNIDSRTADWANLAINRWDYQVQTKDHDIFPITLPLPSSSNTIDIIKRGQASDPSLLRESRLYWKAGLRILDGVAYDKNGNVVNLSYNDSGVIKNPISTHTMYDQREGKTMQVTQVDVDILTNPLYPWLAKINDPPSGGDPGIFYISETPSVNPAEINAVRLVNGSVIPATGLTVATDNPLYIQGDYNNPANRPAAVAADAVTVLSKSWNSTSDSTSSFENNLSHRVAAATTVNAALLTGNRESASGGQYSGGIENFIRFLENWTGKPFTYKGSLVCLWQSEQVTGNWRYGSPVYTAPNRVWSYGIDPAHLPPGTPRVRYMQRIQWYQTLN